MKSLIDKIKKRIVGQKSTQYQQKKAELQPTQPTENKQNEIKQLKTFQFLEAIHSKYLNCKVCAQLMLQPIRLHSCGHTLCNNCVQDKLVKKCPLCLTNIQAKQKDILCSKLVGELAVKCLNEGCPWKGAFEQYTNFHKNGCKLQDGMDQWLKELQNTISQNSMRFGGVDSNNQDQDKSVDENAIKNKNMHPINENNEQQDEQIKKKQKKQNLNKKYESLFKKDSVKNEQLLEQKLEKKLIKKKK